MHSDRRISSIICAFLPENRETPDYFKGNWMLIKDNFTAIKILAIAGLFLLLMNISAVFSESASEDFHVFWKSDGDGSGSGDELILLASADVSSNTVRNPHAESLPGRNSGRTGSSRNKSDNPPNRSSATYYLTLREVHSWGDGGLNSGKVGGQKARPATVNADYAYETLMYDALSGLSGATIQNCTLRVNLTNITASGKTAYIWEQDKGSFSTSATWSTYTNTAWTNSLGSITANATGWYEIEGSALNTLVQSWATTPSSNEGFVMGGAMTLWTSYWEFTDARLIVWYTNNTAPTGGNDAVTFLEDNTTITFHTDSFTYSDGDSDPFAGIKIKSLETAGDLEYSSVDVVDETTYGTMTNLIFKPAADANGSSYASFTHQVYDGTDYSSSTYTMTIHITAVNDEPSFTKGANRTDDEDDGAQNVSAWATGMDKGASNESGQTLTFYVSNDNNSLFSVQPAVNATTGNLTYTPASDGNGSATCTIYIKDDGGTTNGGDDQSDNQTFTITVNAVNDEPSFTRGPDQNVDVNCGPQSVPNWATNIDKGAANESGQTLTFYVSNDNNGLFSSQPAVSSTGTLTYTPATDQTGTAVCTIYLKDDGGTANGGDDQSPNQTFNITVEEAEDLADWGANMKIYINTTASGANVSSTVNNFPLLIRLDPGNFKYFAETEAGGADIRFSKSDGTTQINYEIEKWIDGAGDNDTAVIWVLVDTVIGNNNDQYIMMHWNKPGESTTSNASAVFQTSNDYAAVWHLDEEQAGATGTADVYEDATVNANHADDYVSATGRLGVAKYGHEFDGSDDYADIPQHSSLDFTGDATISGWFRLDADFNNSSGTSQIIIEKCTDADNNLMIGFAGTDFDYPMVDNGSLVFKIEDNDDFRFINTTITSWVAGAWYHFAILLDADNPSNNKVYINGTDVTDTGRLIH